MTDLFANYWEPLDEAWSEEVIIDVAEDTWREIAACASTERTLDETLDIFFPEEYNEQTVGAAREVCTTCPAFEQCRQWAGARFEHLRDGIYFGMGPVDRALLAADRLEWVDWRFAEKPLSRRQLAAKEREAFKKGVPAVVNAYRMYEVEDTSKRKEIVAEYRRWQAEQRYPSTLIEAEKRVKKLADAWKGKGNTRSQSLPPQLRPKCSHGHDPKHMMRHRKTKDGRSKWRCLYNGCGYETFHGEATPEEDRTQRVLTKHTEKPPCPNGHGTKHMVTRNLATGREVVCFICRTHVDWPLEDEAGAA